MPAGGLTSCLRRPLRSRRRRPALPPGARNSPRALLPRRKQQQPRSAMLRPRTSRAPKDLRTRARHRHCA
eukprot:51046-Alexandrium_andersonii.AAC.1